MDRLKLPRSNILGYTMPGFATSSRTLQQAKDLMQAIGCSMEEIDISPGCMKMLQDLHHPFASGEKQYDVTFENVQTGERTSHLFRLANFHQAIVIGTGESGDLRRAFFPHQPVQALVHTECAEGWIGRLAIATRRLACTER